MVMNPPAKAGDNTQVQSLCGKDPMEKDMATHSSILAWQIPWTEEPGRLQSTGSQRVGHDRSNLACMHMCTACFLPFSPCLEHIHDVWHSRGHFVTLRMEPNSKYTEQKGLGVPHDALELSHLSWEYLNSWTCENRPLFYLSHCFPGLCCCCCCCCC